MKPSPCDCAPGVCLAYEGERYSCREIERGVSAASFLEPPTTPVLVPEGFTPWTGGLCPVGVAVRVHVVYANGRHDSAAAGVFNWGPHPRDNHLSDCIVGWREEGHAPPVYEAGSLSLVVDAFNCVTGHKLTLKQGELFRYLMGHVADEHAGGPAG